MVRRGCNLHTQILVFEASQVHDKAEDKIEVTSLPTGG